MDPLAKFYVNSFPNPNYADPLQQGPDGCGNLCNNYIGDAGSSMTTHNVSVKIDHTLSDKHKLFVAWLFNPSYYTNFRYPWNGPPPRPIPVRPGRNRTTRATSSRKSALRQTLRRPPSTNCASRLAARTLFPCPTWRA